jgi:hypothetical protein
MPPGGASRHVQQLSGGLIGARTRLSGDRVASIEPAVTVPFLACMLTAASLYHLPQRVLPAIQHVEGGEPGIVHANANGTSDLGVMQVNTIWIGPLSKVLGQASETIYTRLVGEPCFNIVAAGAIVRTYLDNEKGDLLKAVGDYHSHTPTLNLDYRQKVVDAARGLSR